MIEERGLPADRTFVRVSKSAACQTGTTAGLKTGDRVSVLDLLYGMMLPSGNDAAFAIADFFGSLIAREKISEEPSSMTEFLEKMNSKSK